MTSVMDKFLRIAEREDNMAERIVIPMTERAPVSVDPDVWPAIATSASATESDATFTESRFCVRRHYDGRLIVYGSHAHLYRGILKGHGTDTYCYVGKVFEGDVDPVVAIKTMRDELFLRSGNLPGWNQGIRGAADKCIADLPPEEM